MIKKYDSIGITCEIFKAKNETEHFHRNVELNFVIEGHIKVITQDREFDINAEEMILVDSNKKHSICVEENVLVCRINISYDMLTELLNDEYVMFLCNILTEKDSGYEEIRSIIQQIIYMKLSGNNRESFRLMEHYGKLLDSFIRNYRINLSDDSKEDGFNDSERIRDVLNYINQNYHESISLASLADRMYVSISTLSRNFKKATGMKFPDYVNQIRLHYAVSDLINTNKSITDIAVDNGFSSPSSFNRVFKEIYNTSPSQYKNSFRSMTDDKIASLTTEDKEQIRRYLSSSMESEKDRDAGNIIEIRPTQGKTFLNISTRAVNIGAFYSLTNSAVQTQVRQMIQHLNLKYLRLWNLFSPQCMIAESPDSRMLSFEQVDMVLDFIVEMNIHPFFDLSCRPEVVIKNSKELAFRREDNIHFKSLEQWSFFLDKFMEHVVFRYGSNEISHWLFELTDLPSGENSLSYYSECVYADVYTAAYKIIKTHSPDSKVGGPCWILDGNEIDLKSYFNCWNSSGCMPDFYSVGIFPYINPQFDNDIYNVEKERDMNPDFLKNRLIDIRRQLESCAVPDRPLFITEISTILSNRNALNDHCSRGTNVLRLTNEFQSYTDMVCFWVATDRLSLRYAPPDILHGGSGLMTKDGIPKPSYYALYFLAKMGAHLLAKGEGYIAVQNAPGHIYILCYNHKNLKYDYKYEEIKSVNVHNVNNMFDNTKEISFTFMVYGLEPGEEYVIKRHIINQEYGSVMDEWKRLDFEPEMRSNDIEYLKSVCVPRIQMKRRTAQQGKLMLEANLSAHEMQLLHIYK